MLETVVNLATNALNNQVDSATTLFAQKLTHALKLKPVLSIPQAPNSALQPCANKQATVPGQTTANLSLHSLSLKDFAHSVQKTTTAPLVKLVTSPLGLKRSDNAILSIQSEIFSLVSSDQNMLESAQIMMDVALTLLFLNSQIDPLAVASTTAP
jgi:hypothetical protein